MLAGLVKALRSRADDKWSNASKGTQVEAYMPDRTMNLVTTTYITSYSLPIPAVDDDDDRPPQKLNTNRAQNKYYPH